VCLGSRYDLEEQIGRGPIGTIYRAIDIERGQQVAVKIIHEQYATHPKLAVRFREQLKILPELSNDNLVAPYDYGWIDGRYYAATELVDGQDLGDHIARRGKLPPSEASAIARQVCAALEAVHDRGLVHAGIKPSNILVTPDGDVKVTDAGLAGIISETGLSKTRLLLDGASYMSPEQARGQPMGPESDVYSLGVVLFQMLTGRLPFHPSSVWSLVRMHAEEAPPWLRRLNSQVPLLLEGLVMRSLQKNPADRYSTGAEMQAALTAVMNAGPAAGSATHPIAHALASTLPSPPESGRSGMPGTGSRTGTPILGRRVRPYLFGAGLAVQFLTSFLVALAALYPLSSLLLKHEDNRQVAAEAVVPLGDVGSPMRVGETHETTSTPPPPEPTPTPQPREVASSSGIQLPADWPRQSPVPTETASLDAGDLAIRGDVKQEEENDGHHDEKDRKEDRDEDDEKDDGKEDRQKETDFAGVVEAIAADTWTVDGRIVVVTSKTEIEGLVAVGDYVEVEARMRADGSFFALQIERVEAGEDDD
jgi:serine/threonine-protein kinase